jgi:hypothetical protein
MDNIVRVATSGASDEKDGVIGRYETIMNFRNGNTENCVVNFWSSGVTAAKMATLFTDIRLY